MDRALYEPEAVERQDIYPVMNGNFVFKHAVTRFPETMMEALTKAGKTPEDLDMFIPHQANLRIAQFVQQRFGLPDEKIFNNIQKYGNTTAASIPIALCEALDQGKIKKGPTDNNDKALKFLLRENSGEEYTDFSKLIDNFNYFKGRITEENYQVVLKGLSKLMFVEVSLDREKDDPQRIFESLNSTGLELTQVALS